MHPSGGPSWELRTTTDQHQHVALFARDALGLTDELDEDAIPRVLGSIPNRASLIPDDQRRTVAHAWTSWWTMLVTAPVSALSIEQLQARGRTTPNHPCLNEAVRALASDARDWFLHYESSVNPRGLTHVAEQAAEATAVKLGVTPAELRVTASMLLVEGMWSEIAAPGRLLYSVGLTTNETLLYRVLSAAFASSIS